MISTFVASSACQTIEMIPKEKIFADENYIRINGWSIVLLRRSLKENLIKFSFGKRCMNRPQIAYIQRHASFYIT